jgi:hypothetical protein
MENNGILKLNEVGYYFRKVFQFILIELNDFLFSKNF